MSEIYDVQTFEGAILLPDDEIYVYSAAAGDFGDSNPAEESWSGFGPTKLRTEGIITCAGVYFKGEDCCALIHAYNRANLEALLIPVLEQWQLVLPKPKAVYLVTDYRNKYLPAVRSKLPNAEVHWRTARDFCIERG